jgi:hypothetical protein
MCTSAIDDIAKIILSAKRRRFLLRRRIFKRYLTVSEGELLRVAKGLNFKFDLGLSRWLLLAGYGDIDKNLSFREYWFSVIADETEQDYVSFAQDASGNRYAISLSDGGIYYVQQHRQDIPRIAQDFCSFLQELIQRDYQLNAWMDSISIPK